MHRPGARLLEELAEQEPVEPTEDEPLGAPRCAGDDIDVLGPKAALADQAESFRPRPERERGRHERSSRGRDACIVRSLAKALLGPLASLDRLLFPVARWRRGDQRIDQ